MMVKQAVQACLFTLALGAATDARSALLITECGQTVPANERGTLQNDIVCDYRCSGDRTIVCGGDDDPLCDGKGRCGQESLTLERGAVLRLNGHEVFADDHTAIYCLATAGGGRCTIKGPGLVSGGKYGIVGDGLDVVVKKATISAERDAVRAKSRVTLIDTDLAGSLSFGGVQAGNGLKLVNVRTGDAEEIFVDGDVELRDVELGPRSEISATGTIRGRDVSMIGSAKLYGRSVVLRRATSSPGTGGVTRAYGERSVKLVDSNVVRIASNQEPQLVNSTCEQSFVLDDRSSTWGVCSSD